LRVFSESGFYFLVKLREAISFTPAFIVDHGVFQTANDMHSTVNFPDSPDK